MRRRPSSLFEVAADLRAMLEAIDAELPDEGVRSIERTRQLSCDGAGELAAAPSARKRARSPSPSAVRAAPAAADPGVLAAHTAAAPAVAAPVAVMLAPAARAAAAPASALARRRARLDEPAVRATFACQAPVGRPRTIRNRRLAAPLEELALVYKKAPRNRQDQFRAQVFGKAAKALLGWRAEIETADDLDELFAHHSALAARVSARKAPRCVLAPDGKVASVLRELVAAPRGRERAACRRLTSLLEEQDARARTVLLFSTIWGVGPSTAGEWYARGLKSIDDVRREAERLAPAVAVGLRCIEDFAKRIPRAEVELIKARVRAALVQLVGEGCIVFCDAVGSYRRGRADSGDADILICVNARAGGAADAAGESGSQDSSQRAERAGATRGVLSALVARLRGCGFITDTLAHPTDRNGKGSWMGVCRLGAQSPHRRLDMKVYPKALLPYATLYFTGSDYFNRRRARGAGGYAPISRARTAGRPHAHCPAARARRALARPRLAACAILQN